MYYFVFFPFIYHIVGIYDLVLFLFLLQIIFHLDIMHMSIMIHILLLLSFSFNIFNRFEIIYLEP